MSRVRIVVRREKTLELEALVENGRLRDVVITGDFFAYPPEAVEELEEELRGCRLEEALHKLSLFKDKVTLVGIDFDAIEKALKKVFGEAAAERDNG